MQAENPATTPALNRLSGGSKGGGLVWPRKEVGNHGEGGGGGVDADDQGGEDGVKKKVLSRVSMFETGECVKHVSCVCDSSV